MSDENTNHKETAVSGPGNAATPASDMVENLLSSKVGTVAIVGLGVALIEAELIPGMLIGVAAMLAPNLLPRVGRALRPLIKSTVRAGYAMAEKTRETVAEATENLQDMVAEVRAEHADSVQAPSGSAEKA